MRVLIYARVSHDPRGHGLSVAQQESECRAWAAREGWTVADVIAETGSASRYASRERARWGEVTAAIATGRYDALLTWEASRATRDLTAYATLRELCARHGVAWGYSGVLYDLTRPDDRFRTGLDALVAEQEAARTSERVRRSVRDRATKGRPHGKLPYGYRREYDPDTGTLLRQVPDETTAPIVREIYARVVAGESLYSIARDLTNRGITPPRPPIRRVDREGTWIPITVRRIALSPTYLARRTHKGVDVGPAAWPPLVDPDTHAKARAILTDPARYANVHDSTARHLLSGIATCGRCGGIVRRIKNRGTPSYACMTEGCMGVSRKIEPVDAHVSEYVVELLRLHAQRLAQAPTDRPDITRARADLEALRARLAGFVDAAAEGDVSPAALARIEAKLTPRIRDAERRLHALLAPGALDGYDLADPAALWEGLQVSERRAIVRQLVDVTILPKPDRKAPRVFDPSLIVVTPRWGRPG